MPDSFTWGLGIIFGAFVFCALGFFVNRDKALRLAAREQGINCGSIEGDLYAQDHPEPPSFIEFERLVTAKQPADCQHIDEWRAGYKEAFQLSFRLVRSKAFSA